jgi:hypothetical protein
VKQGKGYPYPGGVFSKEVFEVYIEHFLASTLSEGQVVVMDNLGSQRPKRIQESLGRARARSS